ncbi:MAG TPA: hypothetical protein VLA23_01925, partial [Candidatus Limnocylindrales bacterium]|nr:hypothetical protein [Candidatus Limnocylindrales bacterium]
MRDHFTIEPATDGRFERHGRTQVFVPNELRPSTLYTITISAGLARTGTDLTLATDVVVRFETEGDADPAPWLKFARDTIETSPTEATVSGVELLYWDVGPEGPPEELAEANVRVYRIPSLERATSMLGDFLAAPRWTEHSVPSMPTDGLAPVATFSVPVEKLTQEHAGAIRFPEALPEGWYVVEIQGDRPSQAFLQVTPVSAWVSVLMDRTAVWVNDVATGKPVAGATAEVAGGASIGRSDADGLLVGPTPSELIPPAEARDEDAPDMPPPLVVRAPSGDLVLVPFGVDWNGGIYRGEWYEKTESADPTYWSMLLTERGLYRQTDTIAVWGYLRGRDDGSVPGSVTVRLVRNSSARTNDPPAVARMRVSPDGIGAFGASLRLDRVPIGDYVIQAVVDGRVAASTWLEVGVIRKPAYRLEIQPDQLAVFTGAEIRWTATASFFDGTRVPDLPVSLSLPSEGSDVRTTTDTAGTVVHTAVLTTATRQPNEWDYWDTSAEQQWGSVRPATQEEGEIWADASVLVFPSSVHLDLDGSLDGSTLRIRGAVDEVDLAGVRSALASGTWDDDPDGDPVPGATVKLTITELIPVRRQVGTRYDFIEKLVVPIYEYDTRREPVRTLSVRTGSDGRLTTALDVPNDDHQYEITAATTDAKGRPARTRTHAGPAFDASWLDAGIRFATPEGRALGDERYGIGETVAWRITDDGSPVKAGPDDRFLYIVAQRGLRSAEVTSSPTFEREFAPADAPRIFIMGIRFTGTTYAPKAAAWADFDVEQRELSVEVTADRERYRPGEKVTLAVATRDADGEPVAATVVIQAVDEKLFAMGAAGVPDPLHALYSAVDSGIVRLTSTHQVPTDAGPEGEGGDTTGGGPRADFRDTLAFRLVSTDATGLATTTIELADDLTSWHVSAAALTAGLQAGVDDVLVPVSLPLFVDATIADEYLLTDRPIIRLRAYGDGLRSGDPVTFTVIAPTLGMAEQRLTGAAFEEVDVPLPALALGV